MKRIFCITLVVIMLTVAFTPTALALVERSEEFFVTDAANVLTERTRQDIISANEDLMYLGQGAQVVVVTVQYLDGMPADEYATQLFNDWGVGSAEADNGMLLLLATEELRGWLVVGAGLSGAFTNAMAENYLDTHFWPEVDARNFDTAVRNMCEALFSWFADYYGVLQDAGYVEQPAPQPVATNADWQFNLMFFGIIIVLLIIIFIAMSAGNQRRMHNAYYVNRGMPIPTWHWWFIMRPRPMWRMWGRTHWHHNHWGGGPRGPGGFGGRPPGTQNRHSTNNRNSGGFGGFGGGNRPGGAGRGGGGFGGFGGSGRGGGGGFRGGGGGRSGGGGGRR